MTSEGSDEEQCRSSAREFTWHNNREDRIVRWFRSARRHRIGKAHANFVMPTNTPIMLAADADLDQRLCWIGPDDRGLELQIVALDLPEAIVVIHVMPTALRKDGGA